MRILLLSFLSLPLFSAEIQVSDLRLEIGSGSVSSLDSTIHYRSGPNSLLASQTIADTNWSGSSPVFISAMYSRGNLHPFGFIWALGAEYQGSNDDVAGLTFRTDLIGAKGRAGVGFCPAPNWRLEATVEGQLGIMSVEDADVTTTGAIDRATATGNYSAIGGQLGVGYAFKGHWEAGASLRALGYRADTSVDFSRTGGSYTATYSWMMVSAALSGGYRF